MGTYKRTWLGGYVIGSGRDGKKDLFIIVRRIGGKRLKRSTGVSTERAAIKELEKFELDPGAYRPATKAQLHDGAIEITPELIAEYAAWVRESKGEDGFTNEWMREKLRYLKAWMEDLDGLDLCKLSPPTLEQVAKRHGNSVPHRIATIKVFCSWLRRHKKDSGLNAGNDPTISLVIPKRKSRKQSSEKPVHVSPEHISAVCAFMEPTVKAVLIFKAGTGWHTTEVIRFAKRGKLIDDPSGQCLAIATTRHKNGKDHSTYIQRPEHLAAAKALKLIGEKIPSHNAICRAFREGMDACAATKNVPQFTLGQIRHSFITNALVQGADIDAVAKAVGHRDREMILTRYLGVPLPAPAIPSIGIHEDEVVH